MFNLDSINCVSLFITKFYFPQKYNKFHKKRLFLTKWASRKNSALTPANTFLLLVQNKVISKYNRAFYEREKDYIFFLTKQMQNSQNQICRIDLNINIYYILIIISE